MSSLITSQIIKKVMKMDAAEPFNVPVNPEALGIPVSIKLTPAHDFLSRKQLLCIIFLYKNQNYYENLRGSLKNL